MLGLVLLADTCGAGPAAAAEELQALDGAALGLWWVLPFAGLLLSIAVLPQLHENPSTRPPPFFFKPLWCLPNLGETRSQVDGCQMSPAAGSPVSPDSRGTAPTPAAAGGARPALFR